MHDSSECLRQLCEKYLANGQDVFWVLWIFKRYSIRFVVMVCVRCLECMELEEIVENSAEYLSSY